MQNYLYQSKNFSKSDSPYKLLLHDSKVSIFNKEHKYALYFFSVYFFDMARTIFFSWLDYQIVNFLWFEKFVS